MGKNVRGIKLAESEIKILQFTGDTFYVNGTNSLEKGL